MELEIRKLKAEVEKFQHQPYDKSEDIQNLETKKCKLMEEVEHHKGELAKLEGKIPGIEKKIRNAQESLEELKLNVEDTTDAIPNMEKQVLALVQNLNQYGDDVQDEKKQIADLQRMIKNIEVEQAKQRRQFEDERREREEVQRQMQRIEDEQARKNRQFEDLRRENKDLRRANKECQSQIQNLREVIEEKDNDIRQLKDASTAAAESKVQEPQDAVQEKATQDKHGREEGKTASSDVTRRGATATVTRAGGSVARQGVTQKDSNPRHVDDLLAACLDGNMAEVKRVLDLGQVDINCRGGGLSLTPVMMAAVRGHREVVPLLLSRGADVSLVDDGGNNILHWACYSGDVGTVELILSQDVVDVNARNNDGQTAADVARRRGHHQLVVLVSRAAR